MNKDVMHELLQAGVEDWVSLDEAAWIVTEGDFSPTTKKLALDAFADLYRDTLMVPGDLGESGFEDWHGTSDDWITRSWAELQRLSWLPKGSGFWLRLTDRGRTRLADRAL